MAISRDSARFKHSFRESFWWAGVACFRVAPKGACVARAVNGLALVAIATDRSAAGGASGNTCLAAVRAIGGGRLCERGAVAGD